MGSPPCAVNDRYGHWLPQAPAVVNQLDAGTINAVRAGLGVVAGTDLCLRETDLRLGREQIAGPERAGVGDVDAELDGLTASGDSGHELLVRAVADAALAGEHLRQQRLPGGPD